MCGPSALLYQAPAPEAARALPVHITTFGCCKESSLPLRGWSWQAHTIPITQPKLEHVAPLAKAVADTGAFPDSVWPQSPIGPLTQDGGQWDDEGDDLCDGDDDASMGGMALVPCVNALALHTHRMQDAGRSLVRLHAAQHNPGLSGLATVDP